MRKREMEEFLADDLDLPVTAQRRVLRKMELAGFIWEREPQFPALLAVDGSGYLRTREERECPYIALARDGFGGRSGPTAAIEVLTEAARRWNAWERLHQFADNPIMDERSIREHLLTLLNYKDT